MIPPRHGHKAIVVKDSGFIVNKATGESIKMRRDRNVWVIDAFITEDGNSDFARQETIP